MGASLGANFVIEVSPIGRGRGLARLFTQVRDVWDARWSPVNLSRELRRFEPFTRHSSQNGPMTSANRSSGSLASCPVVSCGGRLWLTVHAEYAPKIIQRSWSAEPSSGRGLFTTVKACGTARSSTAALYLVATLDAFTRIPDLAEPLPHPAALQADRGTPRCPRYAGRSELEWGLGGHRP